MREPKKTDRRVRFNREGPIGALDDRVAYTAAKAVALNGETKEETYELLQMLGLVEPSEENKPPSPEEVKRRKHREQSVNRRQRRREEEQERMRALGVEPEEYGEGDDDDA